MGENMTIYHEIHGTGAPLVLVHGAFGNTALLGDILPALAATRRVIAVDLQGHGRTPDADRPIRPETMADDVAALLSDLSIGKADIMGYSLGGAVALQVAFRHPGIVRKLVVVSEACRRRGWSDEVLAQMDQLGPAIGEMLKQTPLYQVYSQIAPRPQDWPRLVEKNSECVKLDYDWTMGVKGITAPTLLVFGSADGARAGHPQEFLGLLANGRLEMIPGATHMTVFTPVIVPAVTAFLDAP
jgi:pimeloyl-ACP methyl ester carboxylesterase